MYTQCPKCQAVFTIAQDQLDHRDGVVRCGACMGVFDATSNLYEQIPEFSQESSATLTRSPGGERAAAIEIEADSVDDEENVLGFDPNSLVDQVEAQLATIDEIPGSIRDDLGDASDVEEIELATPDWHHAFGDDHDVFNDKPLVNDATGEGDASVEPRSLTTHAPDAEPAPLVVNDVEAPGPVPYSVAGFVNAPKPGESKSSVFGSSAARVADHDPDGVSVEEIDTNELNRLMAEADADIAVPDVETEAAILPVDSEVPVVNTDGLIWPSIGEQSDSPDTAQSTPVAEPVILAPSSESLIEASPSLVPDFEAPKVVENKDDDSLSLVDAGLPISVDGAEVQISIRETGNEDEVVLSVDEYEEDEEDNFQADADGDDEPITLSREDIAAAEFLDDSGDINLEASIDAAFATDVSAPLDVPEIDVTSLSTEPVTSENSFDIAADATPSLDVEAAPVSSLGTSEDDVLSDISDVAADADSQIIVDDDLTELAPIADTPRPPATLTAPTALVREDRVEPSLMASGENSSPGLIASATAAAPAAIEVMTADELDTEFQSIENEQEAVQEHVEPLAPEATADYDDDVEFDDDAFLSRTDLFDGPRGSLDLDLDIDSELASELEFVARLEQAGDDIDFDSDDFIQEHHETKTAEKESGSSAEIGVLDPIAAAKSRLADSIPELREPSFDTQMVPVPAWKTWSTRIGLGVGCLGLVLTLAWQAKAFYLDDLAQVSSLRPILTTVCEWTSCEVPPQRSPDHMSLIATYIDSHPEEPDALRIATQITNSAVFPQPYPNVRLTMTDKQGRIVARRDVSPKEYLAVTNQTESLIEPGQTQQVFFDLMDPRDDAFGYEVELLAAE